MFSLSKRRLLRAAVGGSGGDGGDGGLTCVLAGPLEANKKQLIARRLPRAASQPASMTFLAASSLALADWPIDSHAKCTARRQKELIDFSFRLT